MADSCCIVEMKETIEKLNIELSQSHTKISELDAKVGEQEEENTRLTRDLKECEEKCRATQKRLKFAEQKLAQFSHKPQTAAQTRRMIVDSSSSCSDGSDSDEDRQNPISDSSSSCSDGPDSDDSPTHLRHPQIRRNPINDGSSSCSDGSDSDEDRRNPISDSSSSCSDGQDSDDSLTHVRHPQISLSLVEKDGTSGGVKYVSNIKHMLKRKRPDEETKENNVKTIKLTSILKGGSKIKKSGDATLNINSMPEEIFIKIFGYLSHNDLGRTVQVCRRWNALTKSPVLWRKVNVKIYSSDRKKDTVAKSFINGLPSCVTCIRLDFVNYRSYISNFEEVCAKLHQNCPHVEELILEHCAISNIFPEVINFCTQFLQCVKKLVFHHCHFSEYSRTVELNDNSKIEVLDLYVCKLSHFNKTQFSKLLHLKELRLTFTDVNDTWFVENTSFFNQLHVLNLGWTYITARTFLAIQRHGHNLKELYLCKVHLRDHDLNFNKSAFPHLKTICLSDSFVTCEGVVSLIQSCPSLENVYVDEDVAESFAAHPFVLSNKCKSGIVKAIDSYHIHNVDYIHN